MSSTEGLPSNGALCWTRHSVAGDRGVFHACLGDGDDCRQGPGEPWDVATPRCGKMI